MNSLLRYTLLSLCIWSFSAAAQDEELIQWEKHAKTSFTDQDYYGAAYYYQKALETDSLSLEYHNQLATSFRLANEYQKAARTYLQVISLDVKINYPEAVYHLADMLKRQERYQEAQAYFETYKDIATNRESPFYKQCKNEIQACILADSWQNMHPTVTITHPKEKLNSFDAEFSPHWDNMGNLYFSALRYDSVQTKNISTPTEVYTSNIYKATAHNKQWQITLLDTALNDSATDNANPAFSADGQTIYFTRCNQDGCAIWVSHQMDSVWTTPEKLGPNINLEGYTSTHPNVAQIGKKNYLFFSSNRARTRGSMDIWSVEIRSGNKYGRPKNAGRKVNTKGNEVTPYYNNEKQTLYFSSEFHKGFGGFDVYQSMGTVGKFTAPKNMGKPINSSVNDYYYAELPNSDSFALVSNRPNGYALKGFTCCNDIYIGHAIDTNTKDTITDSEVPVEENLIVKLQALQFLPLALYFDNDQPNPRTRKTITNKTYEETFENYFSRKAEFLNQSINKAKTDTFFSKEVEEGFIKLQMLTDSLYKYLSKGYKLQLGIKGFTSPLGDTEYNDKLALRRISSIENYVKSWQDGVLQPFIDSGLLQFNKIPFGEYLSQQTNDDRNNVRNSVYGIGASKARKVEIVWVEQTLPSDTSAIIQFESTIHNFGTLPFNKEVSCSFEFTNAGASDLIINNTSSNCECLQIEYSKKVIQPGENGSITVNLNTTNHAGLQFHGIIVKTNAKTSEKKLFIRGVLPPLSIQTP